MTRTMSSLWTSHLPSEVERHVSYDHLSFYFESIGKSVGSGRMSQKSPRSNVGMHHSGSQSSSLMTGAVESSISGTYRNRRISQKVLDRITNDPRAGRYIDGQNQ